MAASGSPATPLDGLSVLYIHHTKPDYITPPRYSRSQITAGPFMESSMQEDGAEGLSARLATPYGEYDLAASLQSLKSAFTPDLVLVRADATGANLPRNLASVAGTKVLMVGDTQHLARPLQRLISYALSEPYDIVLSSHNRQHLHFFIEAGVRNVRWLPNMDADCPIGSEPESGQREASIVVAGQIGRFHPARMRLVDRMRERALPLNHRIAAPAVLANLYRRSVGALNCSLNGDVNLRIAEVLCAGGCLITDRLRPQSGLELLYQDRSELYTYGDENEAGDLIEHLLGHPEEALATARRGWQKQLSHLGFAAQRRRLWQLVTRDEIDPLFDLRREHRCSPKTKSGVPLTKRLAIYEHCQELNRQQATVRIGIESTVDPAIVTDLADLNHTKLVLEDGATAKFLRESPVFPELEGVLTIVDRATFPRIAQDLCLKSGANTVDGASKKNSHRESEINLVSDPYQSEQTAIEVLLANNQRDDARRRLEAFLPQAPGSAEAHNDLAVLRQMNNDLAGALEAIQRAVALSPKNVQVQRNLASIHLAAGSPLDALRAVDAAMRLQPNDGETLLVAGDISMVLERKEDARLFYEKAGILSPHLRAEVFARCRLIAEPSAGVPELNPRT